MAAWTPRPAAQAGDRSPCACLRPLERTCTRASTTRRPSPLRSHRRYDRATTVQRAHADRSASPVQARALVRSIPLAAIARSTCDEATHLSLRRHALLLAPFHPPPPSPNPLPPNTEHS